MRALVTSAGTDTPVLADVEAAPVGPADLRIRISAAAVNPIDVFLATERGRAVFGLSGGTGLGSDLTGTVVEAGPQVDGFAVGDRVAALDRDPTAPSRAHADSIVVASADVARIPAGLDPLAAASIPLNALAARQGLDLIGPPAGRSLLVTGAAGAVASAAGAGSVTCAAGGWIHSATRAKLTPQPTPNAGATMTRGLSGSHADRRSLSTLGRRKSYGTPPTSPCHSRCSDGLSSSLATAAPTSAPAAATISLPTIATITPGYDL
ncbi:hypothetical protein GCM10009558_016860 [Virgisporangium aurantiacum]